MCRSSFLIGKINYCSNIIDQCCKLSLDEISLEDRVTKE